MLPGGLPVGMTLVEDETGIEEVDARALRLRDGLRVLEAYEIAEAARRITAGELESPLMSWKDTLDVMGTMDAIRAALGVVYPGEEIA